MFTINLANAADPWLTHYEQSGCTESETYEQTIAFCKRLAAASPQFDYQSYGVSPEGRDLPLLLINGSQKDNPVIMIFAGTHSGEIDGKDAGFTLFRDVLMFAKYPGLLDQVTIAFIPIFSVDGHERSSEYSRINQVGPREMGWRTTAQNLNLNRDWLKADAPEMRAALRLIDRLNPDFLIDLHVTDGADFQYVISYGLGVYENEMPSVQTYSRDVFLPEIQKKMKTSGYNFPEYIVFKGGDDIFSGWESEISKPRFSAGYGSLINRPFLLIETHSLKDYKTRVDATYELVRNAIVTLKEQSSALKTAVREADAHAKKLSGSKYILDWDMLPESTLVDFHGVEFKKVPSAALGGDVIQWGTKPVTYRVPFLDKHRPVDSVVVPLAYIIPPAWLCLLREVLDAHGIKVSTLNYELTVNAETYRFSKVDFHKTPYEGRLPVTFEKTASQAARTYPVGSGVVLVNSAKSQVAVHLLEPGGPDSFVRWGFMNQIFEQKEYAEAYIMDPIASRMLKDDPVLAKEFHKKLTSDPAFAASQEARIQFFYEHSPYWDDRKDVYPIGRIVDETTYEQVLKSIDK